MTWDGVWTQAEVLERLPPSIAIDFDCPAGPHDWMVAGQPYHGLQFLFCRRCPAHRRRLTPWPDMLDPLDTVYALQFSR